jgi:hypothetical protein
MIINNPLMGSHSSSGVEPPAMSVIPQSQGNTTESRKHRRYHTSPRAATGHSTSTSSLRTPYT